MIMEFNDPKSLNLILIEKKIKRKNVQRRNWAFNRI